DDLRRDVANAVNADQLPIDSQKDELQETAPAGDGAARRESKVGAAHLVVDASLTTLLLGNTRARNLWHPINRRDRTRVDGSLERDTKRMTDRNSSLLHRDRCQRRANHVARGVDTRSGRAEVLVHDDAALGVAFHPQGLQAETFRIGNATGGEQERVGKERLA